VTELVTSAPHKHVERALKDWQVATCQDYVLGQSDRFATLGEPYSLSKCGAAAGWGWYKLSWTPDGKSKLPQSVHFPQATGYMQAWLNGKYLGVLNEKSAALPLLIAPMKSAVKNSALLVGAASQTQNTKSSRALKASASGKPNAYTLTLLARQGGTSAISAHQHRAVGVFGHALAVAPLKTKTEIINSPSVDPFKVAAFLPGVAPGHHMSTHAAQISFTYSGMGTITFDAPATFLRAVVLLNGAMIDFIDWRGELGDALVLSAPPKGLKVGLKSGVNQLVLVPVASDYEVDAHDHAAAESAQVSKKTARTSTAITPDMLAKVAIENMCKQLCFYQSAQPTVSSNATWSFARWEMPRKTLDAWQPLKSLKTVEPRWFTTTFAKPDVVSGPISILCEGLSYGHVLLNGKIVGDYNTQNERARIELPTETMPASNTLSIFDVQGHSPAGVKLSFTQ
jgi:hypothetical protein